MSKYVLSTATDSVKFQDHMMASESSGMLTVIRSVMVHGGANLKSSKSGYGDMVNTDEGIPLWTPAGVITTIKDEDVEFLKNHRVFKIGMDAGFYQILDSHPGNDHNKIKAIVASDMTKKDGAAPLTGEKLAKVKITAGKVDEE